MQRPKIGCSWKRFPTRSLNVPSSRTFGQVEEEGATTAKFMDKYSKHRQLVGLGPAHQWQPKVSQTAWVAPNSVLVGNIEIWPKAVIWYNCSVKAHANLIRIGATTNIYDGCVIEEASGPLHEDHDGSTVVGHACSIGQRSILRACTLEDECVVGMGCILEEGSYMETQSYLGAGSVLKKGERVPSGEFWIGNPAEFIRELTMQEILFMQSLPGVNFIASKRHKREFVLDNYVWRDAEENGLIQWIEKDWYERI